MTIPTSIATPLPEPPPGNYGIPNALPLFKTWTRDSFLKASGGIPAPPYDPTRDIKLWYDSNAKAGHTTYNTLEINPDGSYTLPPAFTTFYLPPPQALTLNLPPGPIDFPVWNPPPSDAVETVNGQVVAGLNPFYLSTLAQAEHYYAQFGGVGGIQLFAPASGGGSNIQIVYANDPRRMYQFALSNGQILIVGFLLRQEYVDGVGYPGKWNTSGPVPVWMPGPPPPHVPPNAKVVPVPMRHLYPDESWDIEIIGQPMITRKG